MLLPLMIFALADWPAWRGPDMTGATQGTPVVEWSEKQNIRWKKEIPGFGLATPVVYNNRVYLLSAVKTDQLDKKLEADPRMSWAKHKLPEFVHSFVVVVLDLKTGKVIWEKSVAALVPSETTHGDASIGNHLGNITAHIKQSVIVW